MTSRESATFRLPTRRGFLAGGAALAGASAASGAPAHAAGRRGAGHAGGDWPSGPGRPNTNQRADAELRAIVREIDPVRVRDTIETLVGFGTRHTLSSQDDPRRG